MSYNANFDTENIHSVELNLLDSQVDLILRSLELYGYNLEFMFLLLIKKNLICIISSFSFIFDITIFT